MTGYIDKVTGPLPPEDSERLHAIRQRYGMASIMRALVCGTTCERTHHAKWGRIAELLTKVQAMLEKPCKCEIDSDDHII